MEPSAIELILAPLAFVIKFTVFHVVPLLVDLSRDWPFAMYTNALVTLEN